MKTWIISFFLWFGTVTLWHGEIGIKVYRPVAEQFGHVDGDRIDGLEVKAILDANVRHMRVNQRNAKRL